MHQGPPSLNSGPFFARGLVAGEDSSCDTGPEGNGKRHTTSHPMNQNAVNNQMPYSLRRWVLFSAASMLFGLSMFYRSSIAVITPAILYAFTRVRHPGGSEFRAHVELDTDRRSCFS
jgi:hypothetical protein